LFSPLNPSTRLFASTLALLSLSSCASQPPPPSQVPVRTSFASSEQPTGFGCVAVEPIANDGTDPEEKVQREHAETLDELQRALPLLAEKKLGVALAVQAFQLRDPAAMERWFSVVKEARHLGIEVRPWVLVDFKDGYYPSAVNYTVYIEHTRELVAQWKAQGLRPTTMAVDMEPSRELQAALASLDLTQALPGQHVDRERYAAAQQAYAAFVDELHQAGWKVAITTLPMVLADYRDGDDDLRQFLGVVIDGVDWDQIDFQLYRSAFEASAPGLGPDFVFDYVREAQGRFPRVALGFDLGLTHAGPFSQEGPTLKTGEELRRDVEAALAAGADPKRIVVYNLKGIMVGAPTCAKLLSCSADEFEYGPHDPAEWLQPPDTRLSVPASSAATERLSGLFTAMDNLL
jgi:hypothetical protein